MLFFLFYIDSSPLSLAIKNKGKKRTDTTHDNTREDIKELKPNSSSDSPLDMNFINIDDLPKQNNNDKIADTENKAFHDEAVTIKLDSGIFIYNIKCIDFI